MSPTPPPHAPLDADRPDAAGPPAVPAPAPVPVPVTIVPLDVAPATVADPDPRLAEAPLVTALRGRRPAVTPVWFMRQAGRSLPEYRAVREGVPMLESCRRPELVAEITLQPVRRYGVDAAIFYSDIVVPLKAVGVDLDIKPGVGPVVAQPFRTAADLDRIPPLTPDLVPDITAAVQLLTGELGGTPLIGFAGAPFTLASYLVEGGPSRDLLNTKALMHADPELFAALLARLAQISAQFLRVQVAAGASAVQLFDSWIGNVSLADYRRYVQPASAAVLAAVAGLAPGVPRIHFGTVTGELLVAMAEAGATTVGVDFRTSLADAITRLSDAGHGGVAVQGNLDPALLFAPAGVREQEVLRILGEGTAAPGHVFNLGHGVPPATDPSSLQHVVDVVHTFPAGS